MKKYEQQESDSQMVMEPSTTMSHFAMATHHSGHNSYDDKDFDALWQRSISIDDFRQQCMMKLAAMYGKDY